MLTVDVGFARSQLDMLPGNSDDTRKPDDVRVMRITKRYHISALEPRIQRFQAHRRVSGKFRKSMAKARCEHGVASDKARQHRARTNRKAGYG
jgi:hypothetical protein